MGRSSSPARCTSSGSRGLASSTIRCCATRSRRRPDDRRPRPPARRRRRGRRRRTRAGERRRRRSGSRPTPRAASLPRRGPLAIGPATFRWGERTYVMGILNVTPDSFSGDGLLAAGDPARRGRRAGAGDGRRGRRPPRRRRRVDPARPRDRERRGRDRPRRAGHPGGPRRRSRTCRSASTRRSPPSPRPRSTPGADLVNDVWGVAADDALSRLAAARGVPIVLMHNRAEARYTNLVAEVLADLQAAIEPGAARRRRLGVDRRRPRVRVRQDAGAQPRAAARSRRVPRCSAGRCCSGRRASRRSARSSTCRPTSGSRRRSRRPRSRSPPGVDIVRVHDVRENVRAARMADAIVRADNRSTDRPTAEGDQR